MRLPSVRLDSGTRMGSVWSHEKPPHRRSPTQGASTKRRCSRTENPQQRRDAGCARRCRRRRGVGSISANRSKTGTPLHAWCKRCPSRVGHAAIAGDTKPALDYRASLRERGEYQFRAEIAENAEKKWHRPPSFYHDPEAEGGWSAPYFLCDLCVLCVRSVFPALSARSDLELHCAMVKNAFRISSLVPDRSRSRSS